MAHSMPQATRYWRARVLSFTAEATAQQPTFDYWDDAIIGVADGRVQSLEPAEAVPELRAAAEDLRPGLLMPGFIDTHIHFPQQDMIGCYGAQLMDWLERYAFPAELAYADAAYSAAAAERFLDRLLANGTTTVMAFATVHAASAEALFAAAQTRKLRLIAGKVLMNRNAPAGLKDEGDGFDASAALIERWHGQDRLRYAVTPRFAITSTPEQLSAAGRLLATYPDVYLHSHLSENHREIEDTAALFPDAEHYLGVYDDFGLVTERSHFAHCIHLSEAELERMADSGATAAFCPTSNLFLGSGLLDLEQLQARGISMSVASDVGGGTSFSPLRTLAEGYKVAQLRGYSWHPYTAFFAHTLGNARALKLEQHIGRIAPGFEADWVLLDGQALPLLDQRLQQGVDLEEELFAYQMLGDERAVAGTWINGERTHTRADALEH